LTVAGLVVLGLGIYLFVEVRAAPATAEVITHAPPTAASHERVPAADTVERAVTPTPPPHREARIAPPAREVPTASGAGTPAPPPELDHTVDITKDATMAEANKAYDRGDLDEAQSIALKVLNTDPNNVRMLRIMVSSACILGDSVVAQKHYLTLPPADRAQMRTRCERYGVSFNEQ
jgi:hypothetical protein